MTTRQIALWGYRARQLQEIPYLQRARAELGTLPGPLAPPAAFLRRFSCRRDKLGPPYRRAFVKHLTLSLFIAAAYSSAQSLPSPEKQAGMQADLAGKIDAMQKQAQVM